MQFQVCLEDFTRHNSPTDNVIANCIKRELSKIGVKCLVWVFGSSIVIDLCCEYQHQQLEIEVDITPEIREVIRRDSCDIFDLEFFSYIN